MNYFRCGGGRSTHTATKITVAKTPLASFESNVSGLYIPEILAYFSATQAGSGDPSPINPRPISGVSSVDTTRTGSRNILDPNATNFGNYTISPDGSHNEATDRLATHYLRCKPNTSYKAISDKKITSYTYAFLDIAFYDENLNYISCSYTNNTNNSFTFTTPANAKFLVYSEQFSGLTNVTPAVFATYDRCLVEGDIDSYEPFVGNTYTIAFGGTYYGGYVNVTTGLLTVTDITEDMGNLTWYRTTSYTNPMFYASVTGKEPIDTGFMCEKYKYLGSFSNASSFSLSENYTCGDSRINTQIYFRNDDYSDAPSFKTAMTGTLIKYQLATPQTVQLTPAQIEQLLGQNNVFCSTGDVAVKGWKID